METLGRSFKKDKKLHHAYLITGEREAAIAAILSFLKTELKVEAAGNPDVLVMRQESLGIDDARALKELASRKGFKDRKFFLVAANFLTREAQNSLLKLFEEPVPDTHFFLITGHKETILPTLLSRLSVVAAEEGSMDKETERAVLRFLSLSPSERLEAEDLKELVEEKDKERTARFIDALTGVLHRRTGNVAVEKETFGALLMARHFIQDRSASVKLILEHLSLTVPTAPTKE